MGDYKINIRNIQYFLRISNVKFYLCKALYISIIHHGIHTSKEATGPPGVAWNMMFLLRVAQ